MDVLDILKEKAEITTKELSKYFENDDPDLALHFDSMKYSLFSGGKRIRPFIVLSVCEAFSGKYNDEAMTYACAIECVHTYSLIHDDLPAMDNDDYRRGKPTNHKLFGEAGAILAGDSLIPKAFEIISSNENIPCENRIKAVEILSKAIGAYGMVGGQIMDLEECERSLDKIVKTEKLKTGRLIECAGLLGLLSSGRFYDEKARSAVSVYCDSIGLSFQITDDLLDYSENGQDKEECNFVSAIGREKAIFFAKELTDKAIIAISEYDKGGILSSFARFILERKA